MAFNGTWEIYHEENMDVFLKAMGAPEMIQKMRAELKPVIIIDQKDKDFTFTVKMRGITKVHSFTLGQETQLTGVDGRTFKCVVREEGGKLYGESDKFKSVREIQGDEMVETMTVGSVTCVSRARRINSS